MIISRAGNSWFNVKDITLGKHISVDFSKITGWKNIEGEEELIANPSYNVDILEAKQTELNIWEKHDVYEEVQEKDQKGQ